MGLAENQNKLNLCQADKFDPEHDIYHSVV